MKKLFYILLLVLATGCCAKQCGYLPTTEITEMYAEYIDEWKSQARIAFEEAEKFAVNEIKNKFNFSVIDFSHYSK